MKFLLLLILIVLFLVLLLLCMMMPWKRRRPSAFDGRLFAHRGLHDVSLGIPENSLAAFRRAKVFGYGVEFDVQMTKDKKLVVFHDETLERMCGAPHKVQDLTLKELRRYRLRDTDEKIPLLSEVLTLLAPGTPILCEVKHYGSLIDTEICSLILPFFREYGKNMVLESFSPVVLFWFRLHAGDIFRGQLSCNFLRKPIRGDPVSGFFLKYLLFNFITSPDFFSYRFADRKDFAFVLVQHLWEPHTAAWTVRSEEEYEAAAEEFNAVIFEGFLPSSLKK